MEPGFYLTTLVFAVAGLHLITKAVAYVTRFLAASGLRLHESGKKTVHRDDWYMFFHRSDLIGKPKEKNKTKRNTKSISSSSSEKQKRRDSRPVLRRNFS